MPKKSDGQNMCPICAQPFKDKEIIISYRFWDEDNGKAESSQFGHLDCVLALSSSEDRTHPPRR